MVKLLGFEDLLRATQLYSRLPQGCAVHARFGEGLMCIMMSTHQSNTHTHHLYSAVSSKKLTFHWWTLYGNSQTAFHWWACADLIHYHNAIIVDVWYSKTEKQPNRVLSFSTYVSLSLQLSLFLIIFQRVSDWLLHWSEWLTDKHFSPVFGIFPLCFDLQNVWIERNIFWSEGDRSDMLMDGVRALTSEDASDDREHGFEQG